MKYHRLKDMLLGAMVATLIVGAVPIAYAKVADTMIPVSYNSIKVLVDGKELKTDKEPFTYDGTTYLPVRAVAEAVGKEVKWDSATKTVTLNNKEATAETETKTNTEVKKETTANGFAFSSEYLVESSGNYTYVTGEITNQNNKKYTMIEVEYTFYDKDGSLMGGGNGYVYDLVEGQTKSFKLMESGDYSSAKTVKFQTGFVQ